MARKTFQFRLVTPQGRLLDSAAVAASIPAWDGMLGVLPDRAPIVTKLGMGVLRVDLTDPKGAGEGGSRTFLVEDGFLQMVDNRLTVLTTRATAGEAITESEAQAELAEAEARRLPERATVADVERLERDRERARVKLRMARTIRAGGI